MTLPVSSCELKLADDSVHVAVYIASVSASLYSYTPVVDGHWLHGLVCKTRPSKTDISDVIAQLRWYPVTEESVALIGLDEERQG